MLDLQTIYLREKAVVRSVRAVAALVCPFSYQGVTTAVYVDGEQTSFVDTGLGYLLVTLPPGNAKPAGWSVSLEYAASGGITKREGFPSGYEHAVDGLLLFTLDRAGVVVEVRINDIATSFAHNSPSSILCSVPASVTTLTKIDVLASTSVLGRVSSFDYRIDPGFKTTTGPQKLAYQFVKLLLTTPGTDLLHQTEGGGLSSIIGTNVTQDGTGSLGARAMLAVDNAVAQIILAQSKRVVPPAERLSRAVITNVAVDANDSSSVTVSLNIETFAKEAAVFNFLLGKQG